MQITRDNNKMHLILLVMFIGLATGQVTDDDPTESCTPLNFTCICGTESNEVYPIVPVRKLILTTIERVYMSVRGQKRCYALSHPNEICKRMSCELSPIELESIGGSFIVSHVRPVEISIPEGGLPNNRRSARDSHVCPIKGLNHANIKCERWPTFIDCWINCSFGYALRGEEGSVKIKGISCSYEDDRWWPHNFQECEPYINCKAHLVSAGFLKCHVPVNEPPYCEISCLDYEDKKDTKPKKYVCKDENFESTLPHCARLNKNEPILENPDKPKDKTMTDYEIEEEK